MRDATGIDPVTHSVWVKAVLATQVSLDGKQMTVGAALAMRNLETVPNVYGPLFDFRVINRMVTSLRLWTFAGGEGGFFSETPSAAPTSVSIDVDWVIG